MPAYSHELGIYAGNRYLLSVRADDFNEPDDFCVTLYYKDAETDENIEVARIDTAHGYTHIDRLYRRDEPKEEFDGNVWDACEYLEENWRDFARSYEK
jgi:hypothetical protein